jgi:hypothetical protein
MTSNGDLPASNTHHAQDDDNESEAETVVLSRDDDPSDKKLIKTERLDDDDDRLHSPPSARRRSSDAKHPPVNGQHKHDPEHDNDAPTSPSSRTTSRHAKDTSPPDSPNRPVLSPAARGRSASTVENRKRKVRDEFKTIEPPRQKAKTEGLKDRPPQSPAMVCSCSRSIYAC